ncbi:MAG: NAD(+) kinase [Synechococcales cyanobacterium]
MKAGIIFNDTKPAAKRAMMDVIPWLTERHWQVFTAPGWGGLLGFAASGSPLCHTPIDSLAPEHFDHEMDFALVLGGDGTVLSAARQLAPKGIPMLTINTGHLGFLTEGYLPNLWESLECVLSGDFRLDRRSMLRVQVWRDNQMMWEVLALNELVLHREPLTSMCHFEVTIGQHSALDVAADGVILASPTGSTAYALSAGGPVLTPGVPVLQLIPICPHSLASRALVFEDTEIVEMVAAGTQRLMLVVDGNAGCHLHPGERLVVTRAEQTTDLIRLHRHEFFRIMREKLGWGLTHASKPTSVELP